MKRGKVQRWALVGLGIYLAFCILAVFAPFIAPHDPHKLRVGDMLQPPSREFPFGTDYFGRCVFSRFIFGTRHALLMGFRGAAAIAAISIPLGLLAGYTKRKFRSQKFVAGVDVVIWFFASVVIMIPWVALVLMGAFSIRTFPSGPVWNVLAAIVGVCLTSGLILKFLLNASDKMVAGLMILPAVVIGIPLVGSPLWLLFYAPLWGGFTLLVRNRFLSSKRAKFSELLPALRGVVILSLAASILMNNIFGLSFLPDEPVVQEEILAFPGPLPEVPWRLLVLPGLMTAILVVAVYLMGDHLRKELGEEETLYLQGPHAQ